MNRLTRPLNSVGLRELLRSLSLEASFPKRRFSQATRPLFHAKHFTPSCPRKPLDFSTTASTANRPSFKPKLPKTDTKPAELYPPSVENFIHVVKTSSDHNNIDDVSRSKGSDSSERRNAELPEELSKNVVHLSCESSTEGGICDVYLLGVCHVSKVPSVVEMIEMWRNKHELFYILNFWVFAMFARQLEVVPGSEFRVAYEEARKYGAKVILGDRPIHEMDDDHDNQTDDTFPTISKIEVDERDQYMSYTLLGVARKHSSIVAVVGMGHLPGIQKYWKQPVPINELMTIPPQKPTLSTSKILAYLGILIAGVAIVWGIYLASKM
ncbi:hypothetical protein GQ457_17G023550 [Hibiscus cannabinus]